MTDLEMATDLRATAAYLRTHGWIQGQFGDEGGPRCTAGAYASARGCDANAMARDYVDLDRRINGFYPLAEALGFFTAGLIRIAPWNDAPGRKVEEVLDRLESTALALEVRYLAAQTPAEVPAPELVTV